MWRCVSRVDYGSRYYHDSPTLDEVTLQNAILRAVNSVASDTNIIVFLLNGAMEKELSPVTGETMSLSDIEHKLGQLEAEFSKLLTDASGADDKSALNDRFREILQEQTELKAKRDELEKTIANNEKASQRMKDCKQGIAAVPAQITEWDEVLIRQIVDGVRVESDRSISVTLKSGKCVSETL